MAQITGMGRRCLAKKTFESPFQRQIPYSSDREFLGANRVTSSLKRELGTLNNAQANIMVEVDHECRARGTAIIPRGIAHGCGHFPRSNSSEKLTQKPDHLSNVTSPIGGPRHIVMPRHPWPAFTPLRWPGILSALTGGAGKGFFLKPGPQPTHPSHLCRRGDAGTLRRFPSRLCP